MVCQVWGNWREWMFPSARSLQILSKAAFEHRRQNWFTGCRKLSVHEIVYYTHISISPLPARKRGLYARFMQVAADAGIDAEGSIDSSFPRLFRESLKTIRDVFPKVLGPFQAMVQKSVERRAQETINAKSTWEKIKIWAHHRFCWSNPQNAYVKLEEQMLDQITGMCNHAVEAVRTTIAQLASNKTQKILPYIALLRTYQLTPL